MSVDLGFWKVQSGYHLDNEMVYQRACCEHEELEGLERLPIEAILAETAAAFQDWTALDPYNYEGKEQGSFQISTTPQSVRVDCYSMEQGDIQRFSSILSPFGCPLYDPQLGVRFDQLCVFLEDEAGDYKTQAEEALSRLFPRLELATQAVTGEESLQLGKTLEHIQCRVSIHRAKTITKVTSFLRIGRTWANRSCQCKTAQLADQAQARSILGELLQKSIERVGKDFLERTYYR